MILKILFLVSLVIAMLTAPLRVNAMERPKPDPAKGALEEQRQRQRQGGDEANESGESSSGRGAIFSARGTVMPSVSEEQPHPILEGEEPAPTSTLSVEELLRNGQRSAAIRQHESNSWMNAHRTLKEYEDLQNQAIAEQGSSTSDIATPLIQAANQKLYAVNFFTQAARAHAIGTEEKQKEGFYLERVALAFDSIGDMLDKADKADIYGETEAAHLLREAAEVQQKSVYYFKERIKAGCSETPNEKEADSYYMIGAAFENSAEKLRVAIEKYNSLRSFERRPVIEAWHNAASLQQQSVEPFIKAASAYKLGKIKEGDNWYNAGLGFYEAAESLEKAIRERINEDNEMAAEQHEDAASGFQESIDYFTQAANLFSTESIEEGTRLNTVGQDKFNKAQTIAAQATRPVVYRGSTLAL